MSQHEEPNSKPWADFQFLRGDALLNLSEPLPRCQDCGGALVDGRVIEYPVLISHRWSSAEHPDPDGSQLTALKTLVNAIADIALALFASPAEQRAAAPTLAVHGVLQAAILASRFVCYHTTPRDRDHFLRHLGIWYDYTCMPQKPRIEIEQRRFKASLRNLPTLFSTAQVVSLRQGGDDYMSRGWCLAEGASGDLSDYTPLALDMDAFGQEIQQEILEQALIPSGDASYNPWVRPSVTRAQHFLDSWGVRRWWVDTGTGIEAATTDAACARALCSEQTQECHLKDRCCLHNNFGVWCAHSLCAAQATAKLVQESRDESDPVPVAPETDLSLIGPLYSPGFDMSVEISNMFKHGELDLPVDFAVVLEGMLDMWKIYCTNGTDVVLVGAWLLHSTSSPEVTCAQFFADCHDRIKKGQHVRIAHVSIDENDDGEEVMTARFEEESDDETAD